VEKAWIHIIVVGQAFYQVHVKQGVFPNHHHFTVLFEINHGKFKLHRVEEGLKTLF